MITLYVVIKSQLPDLFAHFKLAFMFSTSCIKQSKLGYCALNLNSCIEQVISLNEEELLPAGIATDQLTQVQSVFTNADRTAKEL
jgi:hypothetical protein